MLHFRIRRGLDLPLAGGPAQRIEDAPRIRKVYLMSDDYVGMKPTFRVQEGQKVKLGQILFDDKKTPGVHFTSPGGGTVKEIVRGAKRSFQYISIELDALEESERFPIFPPGTLDELGPEVVRDNLVASGLWTSFRTRPYSRIPSPQTTPHTLFVNAMDTNPLAADPDVIINSSPQTKNAFHNGLKVLSRICGKKLYCCLSPHSPFKEIFVKHMEVATFAGPHPAGLVGTHIHLIDPVGQQKTVWHIGYQDVIAIGRLFTEGKIPTERIVSLAGPKVRNPRLVRTRLGACLTELTCGELAETGPNRIVSGSVLCGRAAIGDDIGDSGTHPGLGRYHTQVSVIEEMPRPEFFGWAFPGLNKFSISPLLASTWLCVKRFNMNTSMMGGHRAVFPVRQLDDVMPLDIMPIFLAKALEMGDLEQSEQLGMLELDEEDLALCTFVDPGKNDYCANLRIMLDRMHKEEQPVVH
ncbi:MAG TPA: NADH:ubiquinone reductase (Na(+)-transporting) subunit A [Planctomycetaceae bacterium]|nr:NADH:ubiquinone reductase (Na(+)-transporting) subunit A [Planctomycetaceae bacterium]